MNITIVAGARPNFMKIAPIIREIERRAKDVQDLNYRLVHTGQHYDKNLSDTFFQELEIPRPDINLEVKSGSQAEQTAAIMVGFEKYLRNNSTDLVTVVGDVTSTLACAIVAKKEGVDVAHVEAGIRSGDLSMPEEINRMVTDSITDYFFTTSEFANRLLRKNGVPDERIFFVGNVMIDTLLKQQSRFYAPGIWKELRLEPRSYLVLTMHRPKNVDEATKLRALLDALMNNVRNYPVIFPVHPRTRKILDKLELNYYNLHLIEPLGYLTFNYLVKNAFAVLTDSGGITEETTVMHVPCLTLRENTERPETCEIGTNMLVGQDITKIKEALNTLFDGKWPHGAIPELWDGRAAVRIVDHIIDIYGLE